MNRSLKSLLAVFLAIFTATIVIACQVEEEAMDDSPTEGGELMIYSAGPGGLAEDILEGFRESTGIDAQMFQSTTGSVLGRLEAERNNPVADVVVLASWPAALELLNQDLLYQYNDAENVELLHEGWNADNYYFGYSGSALGITYNTDRVDSPGQDWSDYADPDWEDEVNIPDPSESGSALDFVAGYVNTYGEQGWDLFEALQGNEVSVAGANREALNPVISGAKQAVLAGVDYMGYNGRADGEPIDVIYPDSGTVVNPRPVMILNSSENIEDAEAFVDYALSEEVQQMVADRLLLPGRSDIRADSDRIGYEDIPQLDLDWEWMSDNQNDILDRFQSIFR